MVRTRIAPSPTGEDLHIGNLHTALFNFAFAKKNQGQFIVRIEDTDQKRQVEGSEERILKTLSDYGLVPDESPQAAGPYKPYRQSERLELYKKYVQELVAKGVAYYCYCSKERLDELRKKQIEEKKVPRYDKHCLGLEDGGKKIEDGKSFVIRLNVPENTEVSFVDVIRGKIVFNTNDIDDQVLLKSDGFPTYHLAVVVDDHLMKITHVIRGEEWISSTPKHILLYKAFGWDLPIYVHTPLLRNPDKSKLSKRKNPVWASWYLSEGFLPEVVLNYLALMGWSHPQQQEIFSLEEFIHEFTLERIQAVGPVFDLVKLSWMNGEYIRKLKVQSLKLKIFEFFGGKYTEDLIEKTIPLVQERIKTIKEYDEYCRFFIEKPEKYLSSEARVEGDAKGDEIDISKYKDLLQKTHDALSTLSNWTTESIGDAMQKVAVELGIKNSEYFMVIRVVITGKKITPPLNESMEILEKKEVLERLKNVK